MQFGRFFLILSLLAGVSAFADETSLAGRAEAYDKFFFPSGRPHNYLDAVVNRSTPGTREFRTVLSGVLYRGGGPGGKVQLGSLALNSLCEAGFSLAVYAYATPFHEVSDIHCRNALNREPNILRYIAGAANTPEFKARFLKEVRAVIANPSAGPVFEHCWNGYHASGELAAVALRQFCAWDGPTASSYWLRHSGGYPLISRIGKFVPSAALDIPAADQAVLCQQKQ